MTSNNNKNEHIDNTQASSAGGEASADYIIRGAGEEAGNDTEEDRTTTNETGISDKLKGKVKGAKDKVVGTTQKAVDTTKKTVSSSTSQETEETTRVDRTKDPTQEYDEKEPMSPAKIKQHEPTAVRRDPSDQKIIGSGQQGTSAEDAKEKARRSGMTKGTAGAAIEEGYTAGEGRQDETTVPITEERLDVSKRESAREATITKKPVTETKTVEVPVTHEEISVERRPVSNGTTATDRPVESEQQVRVPLKQEQVEVTKQPYVKEEVSVKKKPVTETKTVTDQVTSEKVKVKGDAGEEEEEEV